jgi:hypothetical protein
VALNPRQHLKRWMPPSRHPPVKRSDPHANLARELGAGNASLVEVIVQCHGCILPTPQKRVKRFFCAFRDFSY